MTILDEKQVADIERRLAFNEPLRVYLAQFNVNVHALCATVKQLRKSFEISEANRGDDARVHGEIRRDLQSQLEQLRAENEKLKQ